MNALIFSSQIKQIHKEHFAEPVSNTVNYTEKEQIDCLNYSEFTEHSFSQQRDSRMWVKNWLYPTADYL